jgi:hypothetical protein
LKSNDKLVAFNKRIIYLTNVFNNDQSRYFFLVALISSDFLVDAKSCDDSIQMLEFIKKNIDLINIDDKTRKEVMKYVRSGLRIAKRDRKMFIENKDSSIC